MMVGGYSNRTRATQYNPTGKTRAYPNLQKKKIWAEAAEYFDEPGLSALVSMVALTNFFNRVNTTLRVQPGSWD